MHVASMLLSPPEGSHRESSRSHRGIEDRIQEEGTQETNESRDRRGSAHSQIPSNDRLRISTSPYKKNQSGVRKSRRRQQFALGKDPVERVPQPSIDDDIALTEMNARIANLMSLFDNNKQEQEYVPLKVSVRGNRRFKRDSMPKFNLQSERQTTASARKKILSRSQEALQLEINQGPIVQRGKTKGSITFRSDERDITPRGLSILSSPIVGVSGDLPHSYNAVSGSLLGIMHEGNSSDCISPYEATVSAKPKSPRGRDIKKKQLSGLRLRSNRKIEAKGKNSGNEEYERNSAEGGESINKGDVQTSDVEKGLVLSNTGSESQRKETTTLKNFKEIKKGLNDCPLDTKNKSTGESEDTMNTKFFSDLKKPYLDNFKRNSKSKNDISNPGSSRSNVNNPAFPRIMSDSDKEDSIFQTLFKKKERRGSKSQLSMDNKYECELVKKREQELVQSDLQYGVLMSRRRQAILEGLKEREKKAKEAVSEEKCDKVGKADEVNLASAVDPSDTHPSYYVNLSDFCHRELSSEIIEEIKYFLDPFDIALLDRILETGHQGVSFGASQDQYIIVRCIEVFIKLQYLRYKTTKRESSEIQMQPLNPINSPVQPRHRTKTRSDSVPLELYRWIFMIFILGPSFEGIFRISGSNRVIESLYEQFTSGKKTRFSPKMLLDNKEHRNSVEDDEKDDGEFIGVSEVVGLVKKLLMDPTKIIFTPTMLCLLFTLLEDYNINNGPLTESVTQYENVVPVEDVKLINRSKNHNLQRLEINVQACIQELAQILVDSGHSYVVLLLIQLILYLDQFALKVTRMPKESIANIVASSLFLAKDLAATSNKHQCYFANFQSNITTSKESLTNKEKSSKLKNKSKRFSLPQLSTSISPPEALPFSLLDSWQKVMALDDTPASTIIFNNMTGIYDLLELVSRFTTLLLFMCQYHDTIVEVVLAVKKKEKREKRQSQVIVSDKTGALRINEEI